MIDPSAIAAGAGAGVAALTSLFVLWPRGKRKAAPQALPSSLSTEPVIDAEAVVRDAVCKAVREHWLHEAGHKVPFDEKQRLTAATQRAVRAIHFGKVLAPADLRERVKKELEATKGVAHG